MGKYKRDKGLQIPMEQRQKLNAKILYLVDVRSSIMYTRQSSTHTEICLTEWVYCLCRLGRFPIRSTRR